MELATRLAIALSLVALGVGVYWSWNRWWLRRLSRRSARLVGLEALRPGVPAVLYFTTPECVPCRTAQRPALERLQAELADGVQIIVVDASAQPAVADYWGVLSVPTTFIIDAQGQPRRVNHGVTGAAKLKRQLEDVSAGRPGPEVGPRARAAVDLKSEA